MMFFIVYVLQQTIKASDTFEHQTEVWPVSYACIHCCSALLGLISMAYVAVRQK